MKIKACLMLLCGIQAFYLLSAARVQAQAFRVVDVSLSGQATQPTSWWPSISDDGRFVAFLSSANNLVVGDYNNEDDDFVRDMALGVTRRVSVSSQGREGTRDSNYPKISGNGRYVVFCTYSQLSPVDTNSYQDTYLHDLQTGLTEIVSIDNAGQAMQECGGPTVSRSGDVVVFGNYKLFIKIRSTGQLLRVNDYQNPVVTWESHDNAVVSPDGTFVVFEYKFDLYTFDIASHNITRISFTPGGNPQEGTMPNISGNGRFIAYQSHNATPAIWVYDRQTGTTTLETVKPNGEQSFGHEDPRLNYDGRYLVFTGGYGLFAQAETSSMIVMRDRQTGQYSKVFKSLGDLPWINADGRYIAFMSHQQVLPEDRNAMPTVYLADTQCIQDSDNDGTPDCQDGCPVNPAKTDAGYCGCNRPDVDANGNGVIDCLEGSTTPTPQPTAAPTPPPGGGATCILNIAPQYCKSQLKRNRPPKACKVSATVTALRAGGYPLVKGKYFIERSYNGSSWSKVLSGTTDKKGRKSGLKLSQAYPSSYRLQVPALSCVSTPVQVGVVYR